MQRNFNQFIALSLCLSPALLHAAAIELPRSPTPEGWQVTLGIAPVVAPVYSGAQDYAFSFYLERDNHTLLTDYL